MAGNNNNYPSSSYPQQGGRYPDTPPAYYQSQPPLQLQHQVQTVQPNKQNSYNYQPKKSSSIQGLNQAIDCVTQDLSKVAKTFTSEITNTFRNPLELLQPGYTVQIESKVSGKKLRVLENGLVDGLGEKGTASEFVVVSADGIVGIPSSSTLAIKFRNVAQPRFHLAIIQGYAVGYGIGGRDCDFIPMMSADCHVTLESAANSGSHLGILPSGQLTAPAQTTKLTDAAHFKIIVVRN